MSASLTPNDWITISGYLDGRLSESEVARVDDRLKTDPQFQIAFREIQHTRSLLRSLPIKRAPRNFTLSQKYAKAASRRWGVHSFLGIASASAALALLVLFVGVHFLPLTASRSAVPMNAVLPEGALTTSAAASSENNGLPMIITWNQAPMGTGKGGGGGVNPFASQSANPGYGGGGPSTAAEVNPPAVAATEAPQVLLTVPPVSTETPLQTSGATQAPTEAAPLILAVTPPPAENPQTSAEANSNANSSYLILGLPAPGTGGEVINQNAPAAATTKPMLPASTIWMIGLGVLAMVCAGLAILLHRR